MPYLNGSLYTWSKYIPALYYMYSGVTKKIPIPIQHIQPKSKN